LTVLRRFFLLPAFSNIADSGYKKDLAALVPTLALYAEFCRWYGKRYPNEKPITHRQFALSIRQVADASIKMIDSGKQKTTVVNGCMRVSPPQISNRSRPLSGNRLSQRNPFAVPFSFLASCLYNPVILDAPRWRWPAVRHCIPYMVDKTGIAYYIWANPSDTR